MYFSCTKLQGLPAALHGAEARVPEVQAALRCQGRARGRAADQLRHHGRLTADAGLVYLNTNLGHHVRPTPPPSSCEPLS